MKQSKIFVLPPDTTGDLLVHTLVMIVQLLCAAVHVSFLFFVSLSLLYLSISFGPKSIRECQEIVTDRNEERMRHKQIIYMDWHTKQLNYQRWYFSNYCSVSRHYNWPRKHVKSRKHVKFLTKNTQNYMLIVKNSVNHFSFVRPFL